MVLYSNVIDPNGNLVQNTQPAYNMFKQGYPGVYEVISINENGNRRFELKEISKKYNVPPKLYGKLNFYINFYWKAFRRTNFKSSVLLTGIAGAGKTEVGKVLSNRCIEYGLRVISITNIRFSVELLRFIEELEGVVLFFDEFGKNFQWNDQQKMLTLFSNTLDRERVVIITENEIDNISSFIRNRPGRVRFAKHFEKLESETVKEYLEEYPLSNSFKDDLMELYNTASVFAFDHLKGIVDEHLANLEIPFKDLIDLLNLGLFKKDLFLHIQAIKYTGDDEQLSKIKFKPEDCTMSPYIMSKENLVLRHGHIDLKITNEGIKDKPINTGFHSDDISFFDKNNISFTVDDFIIECIFSEVTPKSNSSDMSRPPSYGNRGFGNRGF